MQGTGAVQHGGRGAQLVAAVVPRTTHALEARPVVSRETARAALIARPLVWERPAMRRPVSLSCPPRALRPMWSAPVRYRRRREREEVLAGHSGTVSCAALRAQGGCGSCELGLVEEPVDGLTDRLRGGLTG